MRSHSGEERETARLRLLELFEVIGSEDRDLPLLERAWFLAIFLVRFIPAGAGNTLPIKKRHTNKLHSTRKSTNFSC